MRTQRFTCLVIAFGLSAHVCAADVMVARGKRHSGTFRGYSKNMFQFRTTEDKTVHESRVRVTQLTLDRPLAVDVLRKGKNRHQRMELKKYQAMKFTFLERGRAKRIAAHDITEILVQQDSGPMGGQPVATDTSNTPTLYDVEPIKSRTDLTAQQSQALTRYEAAKNQYEQFRRESSRLVSQMDRSTRANRAALLAQLRVRKEEEQPIKNKLRQATAALLSSFPELASPNGQTVTVTKRATRGVFVMVILSFPSDTDVDARLLVQQLKAMGLHNDLVTGDEEPVNLPEKTFAGFVQAKNQQSARNAIHGKLTQTLTELLLPCRFAVLVSSGLQWGSGEVSVDTRTVPANPGL